MPEKLEKGAGQATGCVLGWLDDFKQFINQGSVVDLAVGVMMGAAFGAVVKSFVSDMLTPIISLAGATNLETMFLVLREGTIDRKNLTTIEEAQKSGAITINYGRFCDTIINLFTIAVVLFFMLKIYLAALRRVTVLLTKFYKCASECEESCKMADETTLTGLNSASFSIRRQRRLNQRNQWTLGLVRNVRKPSKWVRRDVLIVQRNLLAKAQRSPLARIN